jgi:YfiH family protein
MTKRIRRVTTTRAGGVSAPPFDTFNLGDHVGDDPAAVAANRARLAAAIGLPTDRVIWMNQVHGDHVEFVDAARAEAFDATDALVTTTPGLALAVVTADCVPVLMADAEAGVLGAAHAGRVGAANGVVLRTLEAMLAAGARAPDVSVLLGPAVSGAHYEVPEEMAADVEARRVMMRKLQTMLQQDGPIVQPFWRGIYTGVSQRLQGFTMHPTFFHFCNEWSVTA